MGFLYSFRLHILNEVRHALALKLGQIQTSLKTYATQTGM
jgi:hypothetical protein